MAKPLRFRRSTETWSADRVRSTLYQSLDANIGATARDSWYVPPSGYVARRFEMENGDVALFCWPDDGDDPAYWMGNTQTPSTLWRTDKYTFDEVPYPIARWAQRELLAQLHEEAAWLAAYPHVSWFFLPVLLSKDGRETTRRFLREHAAGFPDADWPDALGFYEQFLHTGALDDYRYVMASKLGTSEGLDWVRMSAAMGEFNVAKLLHDADYDVTPEIEVSTGHSIDFRADPGDADGIDEATLVEVTRPLPTSRRSADTPVAAIRDTAATKTDSGGQLREHGGGVVLFVDCSSFPDDAWARVRDERPDVGHRPAVVFRARPSGRIEGYARGSMPLDLGDWLA